MFCKKCGSELPNDTLFCPNCGTQVSESARRAAEQATPPSPLARRQPALQPQAPQRSPQAQPVPQQRVPQQPVPQQPVPSAAPVAAAQAQPAQSGSALRIVEGVLGVAAALCIFALPVASASFSVMGSSASQGIGLFDYAKMLSSLGENVGAASGSLDSLGMYIDTSALSAAMGMLIFFFVLMVLDVLFSVLGAIMAFVGKKPKVNPVAFGTAVFSLLIILAFIVISALAQSALESELGTGGYGGMAMGMSISAGSGVIIALLCGIGMAVLEIVRNRR